MSNGVDTPLPAPRSRKRSVVFRALAVAACAVIGAAIGWSCGTVEHRAVAHLEVVPRTHTGGVLITLVGNPTQPMFDAFADSQAALCRSPRVADGVLRDARWIGSPDVQEFGRRFDVKRVRRTMILQVEFVHADPAIALCAVELATEHVLDMVAEQASDGSAARLDALHEESDRLRAEFALLRVEQADISNRIRAGTSAARPVVGCAFYWEGRPLSGDELAQQQPPIKPEADRVKRKFLAVGARIRDLEAEGAAERQPPLRLMSAARLASEPAHDTRLALAALGAAIALVLAGGVAVTMRP